MHRHESSLFGLAEEGTHTHTRSQSGESERASERDWKGVRCRCGWGRWMRAAMYVCTCVLPSSAWSADSSSTYRKIELRKAEHELSRRYGYYKPYVRP